MNLTDNRFPITIAIEAIRALHRLRQRANLPRRSHLSTISILPKFSTRKNYQLLEVWEALQNGL